MQPESYIEEARKQSRIGDGLKKVLSVCAVVCGFLMSGGVHEAGHIALLESLDCSYVSYISGFPLRGEVQPLCGMSSAHATGFYLSGYTAEVLIAGLLSEASSKLDGLGWLTLGLVLGLAFNLAIVGDLARVSAISGAGPILLFIGYVAAGIGVSVSALRNLEW